MNLAPLSLDPTCAQFQSSAGIEACRLCSCAIMLSKWLFISLLALEVQNISAGTYMINYDLPQFNMVFYNLNTQMPLQGALEYGSRNPFPGVGFRGVKCDCDGLTCGCCSGINITRFNINQQVCTNFTYQPEDLAIQFKFVLNNREVVSTGAISGRNPPPFCIPIYPPFAQVCVRFFDIYMSGRNLHACIDLETNVVGWPVLILHFDCVQIGADGISWMKPDAGNGQPAQLVVIMPEANGPEVYDQVDFEPEIQVPNNHNSSMTPEEENNIGQLKL